MMHNKKEKPWSARIELRLSAVNSFVAFGMEGSVNEGTAVGLSAKDILRISVESNSNFDLLVDPAVQ